MAAPAGRACSIALAAANRGARVELVGRVGEDAAGEALLLALARAGVGHAAVLRDPVHPTPVVAPAPPDDADQEGDEDVSPLGEAGPAVPPPPDGPRLEGADVDLAIRYLEPSGVMVVADDVPADALAAAVEAGRYAGTRLVVLLAGSGPGAGTVPSGLPEDATVLVAPDADDEDAFARLVGAYAAALDGGADASAAFEAAAAEGWEASPAG